MILLYNTVCPGAFGRVYSARRLSDNKQIALKFFGYGTSNPDVVFINNEIILMTALLGLPGVIQLESVLYDTAEGFMPNKVHLNQYPIIAMEMVGTLPVICYCLNKNRKAHNV